MKIYLATDHAGYEFKNKLVGILKSEGYEVEDCGPFEFNRDDDYPDWISKAAQKVSADPQSFGIVLGGSGQGEAIVANKFKNVRCALFYSQAAPKQPININGVLSDDLFEIVRLAREHNNANMLSLGIRFLTEVQMLEAIKIFIANPFSPEERHARRVEKIKQLET